MSSGRLRAAELLSAEHRSFLRDSDPDGREATGTARATRADNHAEESTRETVARSAEQARARMHETRGIAVQQPATKTRGVPLQSVTLRLNPEVARALRRAASERAVDYVEPFTQQAISETALQRWLTSEGYTIKA